MHHGGNRGRCDRSGSVRDVERFLEVSVDPQSGAVQWEDGIQLDPRALYKDLASRVRAALH